MNLGLGLNIATTKSGGGLLGVGDTATPTAGYSLRPLSIESYGKPVVKVRRSSDNTEQDFTASEITNGTLESWIHSANESPSDYGAGAAAAYSLRYVSDSYTGNVVRVRRSVDNEEQDFTPSEITDGTMTAWVNTDVVKYTSDFTSGNEDLIESNGTGTDGETIAGVSDAYKFALSGGNTTHHTDTAPFTITKGQNAKITFDYYIPEGQTITRINVRTNNNNDGITFYAATLGSWDSFTLNLDSPIGDRLRMFAATSNSITPDADGDVFYLKNIVVTQTTADGNVTTWYDQSGNNRNATNTTDTEQPKIVDAGVLVEENGKPALDFDGVDDYLQTSVFTASTQPITKILVAKQNGSGYLIDGSAANRGVIGSDPNTLLRRIFAGTTNDYAVNITGNQELLYGLFDGANSELFVNSSGLGAKNVGTGGLDQVTIGTIHDASLSSTFVNAQIQEIIVYASDQSANKETIEANINKYYGIYTPTVDGFVSKWYDQFGSNDAEQTTASDQPKIWDASTGLVTENGKPALEFDGSDDYLQASSLNISQPTMYFIVAKRDALTGKQNYIDGATDRQEVAIDSFNDTYDMFAGAGAATSVVVTTNQEVLVALFNGASSELFVNAVEIVLSATPGTDAINSLLVGADTDQSDFLDGKMQEIIIYDADQGDKVLLQDNINDYYVLYGLKHYRQRVLADSGTFALQGRDAIVYNSVTIPEMPSLICSCDAYKETKLYNINPA